MRILKLDNNEFKIDCNLDELMILANAITNIPQAVDDVEYTSLIGATVDETKKVQKTILDAVRSV